MAAPGAGKINAQEPSVKEYNLGGGKVFFAELDAAGFPKNFRKAGNTPEFTATVNTESYEHNSTQDGAPAQDLSVIIDSGASVSFSLENWSAENLALFYLGEASQYTNPCVAGFTDSTIVEDGDLVKYGYYQVKDGSGNPVFGITSTNAIEVKTTNVTPVTLTENTDYTVDANSGLIHIEDTAAIDTAISGSEGLTCSLTADGTATDVDLVTLLSDIEKDVALLFESINAADSNDRTYYHFHKISLAANGDANLISQETGQLPMTGQVEANDAFTNRADFYTPVNQV
jgi:hypothetical protein